MNIFVTFVAAFVVGYLARTGGATIYRTFLAAFLTFLGFLFVSSYISISLLKMDPDNVWYVETAILAGIVAYFVYRKDREA
jgi:hypothetical protein